MLDVGSAEILQIIQEIPNPFGTYLLERLLEYQKKRKFWKKSADKSLRFVLQNFENREHGIKIFKKTCNGNQ